jgi:hypothetical protein
MDNKLLVMKTIKYDVNNLFSYKDKAYVYNPEYCYYVNGRAHAFYCENDPYPKIMSQWFEINVEDRAANLHALKESKVIQEIVKGSAINMLIIILIAVNILMSIAIIGKLWGAFDGK